MNRRRFLSLLGLAPLAGAALEKLTPGVEYLTKEELGRMDPIFPPERGYETMGFLRTEPDIYEITNTRTSACNDVANQGWEFFFHTNDIGPNSAICRNPAR